MAERLRRLVDSHAIPRELAHLRSRERKPRCRGGDTPNGLSRSPVISASGEALHRAKRLGRNRAEVAVR